MTSCPTCSSLDIHDFVCLDCGTVLSDDRALSSSSSAPEWKAYSDNKTCVRCRTNYFELWYQKRESIIKKIKADFEPLCADLNLVHEEVNTLYDKAIDELSLVTARHAYLSLIAHKKGACITYICKQSATYGIKSNKRSIILFLNKIGLSYPTSLQEHINSYAILFRLTESQTQHALKKASVLKTTNLNGLTTPGIAAAILLSCKVPLKDLALSLKLSEMTIRNTHNKIYKQPKNSTFKAEPKVKNPDAFTEELKCLNPGARFAALLWFENQHLSCKDIDNMLATVSLPTVRTAIKTIKKHLKK